MKLCLFNNYIILKRICHLLVYGMETGQKLDTPTLVVMEACHLLEAWTAKGKLSSYIERVL